MASWSNFLALIVLMISLALTCNWLGGVNIDIQQYYCGQYKPREFTLFGLRAVDNDSYYLQILDLKRKDCIVLLSIHPPK